MNIFQKKTIGIFLSLTLTAAACASNSQLTSKSGSAADQDGAVNILDLSATGDESKVVLSVTADGPIQHTVFKMSDPMRLIVDLSQVNMSEFTDAIDVNNDPVTQVRPLYFDKTNDSRLEVDLASDADYSIGETAPNELEIIITAKTGGDMQAEQAASQEEPTALSEEIIVQPEPLDEAQVNNLVSGFAKIEKVEFKQLGGLSRVEVTLAMPKGSDMAPAYELVPREQLKRLTLDLPGAVVASDDEKLINVNLDQSKINNIAVFQFAGGENPVSKVVVNLEEMTFYNVSAEGNKVILDVGDEAMIALATEVSEEDEAQLAESEPVTQDEPKHSGAKISLDFQKADIHNILRIIADVSGLNIITSEAVKGDVTIKLKNVPWDQALEVILKNNGLDMIREGNIIRVSTADQIQKEKEAQEKLQATEQKIAPLFTKLFAINYEAAGNMKTNLESLKSERGTVEINSRTNTLIVKDTKDKLREMQRLIDALDKKEQQVLIEARIVEVTHRHAKELGVQWGGHFNTVTGTNFPNTVGVTGNAGGTGNAGVGGTAVSLPTTAPPTGALGLTLGHVNGTALLDLRLMAMQSAGKGRIVSMPKITTMNNKEAMIESGQEVPYATVSSEGTKVEFKKATLSLRVTPHVTPDDHIRLEIQTTKDEVNFDQAIGGVPPITTKQASTEVLVADGDTTVIGGLFKDTDSMSDDKVPLFGDVPVLGWLFKRKGKSNTGEELLIFITPKIVE